MENQTDMPGWAKDLKTSMDSIQTAIDELKKEPEKAQEPEKKEPEKAMDKEVSAVLDELYPSEKKPEKKQKTGPEMDEIMKQIM